MQVSSGSYKKYLQPWHSILLQNKNLSATYASLHPHVVAVLVDHYHLAACHSGDVDRPYKAADFDCYEHNDMMDLLQAIERSDNANFKVSATDETRAKLDAELARGKWQNDKPPAADAWYACTLLVAHVNASPVHLHPPTHQDVLEECPRTLRQTVAGRLQPGSACLAGLHMHVHVHTRGLCSF